MSVGFETLVRQNKTFDDVIVQTDAVLAMTLSHP